MAYEQRRPRAPWRWSPLEIFRFALRWSPRFALTFMDFDRGVRTWCIIEALQLSASMNYVYGHSYKYLKVLFFCQSIASRSREDELYRHGALTQRCVMTRTKAIFFFRVITLEISKTKRLIESQRCPQYIFFLGISFMRTWMFTDPVHCVRMSLHCAGSSYISSFSGHDSRSDVFRERFKRSSRRAL